MVLPEFRNGPVGFYVLKELVSALGCQFSLAGAGPAIRLFTALGFTDLGLIPNYVKLLRPGQVVARLNPSLLGSSSLPAAATRLLALAHRLRVSRLAGGLLRIPIALAALRGAGFRGGLVDQTKPLNPDEAQLLWEKVRSTFPAAAARDRLFVGELIQAGGERYRSLVLRDKGEMLAYALLRTPSEEPDPRLAGIQLCTVSDLVYPLDSPAVGLRMLAECERAARTLGAHALLCSSTSPVLGDCLRRRAFLRMNGNIHFLARCALQPEPPKSLDGWWLLRGDSQADANF
jgi:hypothetical protein